jgi:hypothetical protein
MLDSALNSRYLNRSDRTPFGLSQLLTKSTHFVALPEYPRNSPHRAAWVSFLNPTKLPTALTLRSERFSLVCMGLKHTAVCNCCLCCQGTCCCCVGLSLT